MRNIVTIILICFLSFPAFGQEIENSHKDKTYKNIYLELLGASNMIGVSYDTRIKPGRNPYLSPKLNEGLMPARNIKPLSR